MAKPSKNRVSIVFLWIITTDKCNRINELVKMVVRKLLIYKGNVFDVLKVKKPYKSRISNYPILRLGGVLLLAYGLICNHSTRIRQRFFHIGAVSFSWIIR